MSLFKFKTKIETGSDKSFGLFFSIVFALLSLYFFLQTSYFALAFFCCLTLTFTISSIFLPKLLHPLNLLWTFIGLSLGTVFRPIVMGAIFFLLITPIACFMRLFGRDELSLDKLEGDTYWKKKESSDFNLDFFKNQF